MEEIDIYISDLHFDRFILEQQWTAEDESMYQDMMWRAEDQELDYQNELENIGELIGDSYTLEEGALTDWIAAYPDGEDAYNELKNRKDDLDEWLAAVEGEISEYEEVAEEYTAQKNADAAARMIEAQQEELQRAAEQRASDEKRIKHERDNAEAQIRAKEAELE
jgi:hypothetical protein